MRERAEGWSRRPAAILLAWLAVLYLVLLIAAVLSRTYGRVDAAGAATLLLFLGFLPLINAVADWLSTGLTRCLLRQGTAGRLWLWGPVDLVLGAGVFFLLGFAVIGTVRLVEVLGGPALVDLAVILGPETVEESILHSPGNYLWLYATFLSTLLPTALHGLLVALNLVLHWPGPLRRWIATGLEKGVAGNAAAGRGGGRWHCPP